MNENTQTATQHLEKAKRQLALAGESEAYAEVSNLKRELEIQEEN